MTFDKMLEGIDVDLKVTGEVKINFEISQEDWESWGKKLKADVLSSLSRMDKL